MDYGFWNYRGDYCCCILGTWKDEETGLGGVLPVRREGRFVGFGWERGREKGLGIFLGGQSVQME